MIPPADRRQRNVGPPPGMPDRRKLVRYDGRITLGCIIQTLTMIASVAAGLWQADEMLASIAHDLHKIVAEQHEQK